MSSVPVPFLFNSLRIHSAIFHPHPVMYSEFKTIAVAFEAADPFYRLMCFVDGRLFLCTTVEMLLGSFVSAVHSHRDRKDKTYGLTVWNSDVSSRKVSARYWGVEFNLDSVCDRKSVLFIYIDGWEACISSEKESGTTLWKRRPRFVIRGLDVEALGALATQCLVTQLICSTML